MRATRAIDALHGVVPLKFYGGWGGRGQGEMSTIHGTVWHDTVTPYPPQGRWTVEGMLKLLAFGREGLRGSLSQFGMEPDGTWWVIADGKCWHNGYGIWGNNSLGLEVMAGSTIVSPPQIWTPAQFESAAKGTAAIVRAGVHPAANVQGHKEQDKGRKIDPYGVDMHRGRDRVRHYLLGGASTPVPEEDPVFIPVNLRPGEDICLQVEPEPGHGGTKNPLLVLQTHGSRKVPMWIFQQAGGPGNVTIVAGQPYILRPRPGWLHIVNLSPVVNGNVGHTNSVGGQLIYQRV